MIYKVLKFPSVQDLALFLNNSSYFKWFTFFIYTLYNNDNNNIKLIKIDVTIDTFVVVLALCLTLMLQ